MENRQLNVSWHVPRGIHKLVNEGNLVNPRTKDDAICFDIFGWPNAKLGIFPNDNGHSLKYKIQWGTENISDVLELFRGVDPNL